jgi:Bax protein
MSRVWCAFLDKLYGELSLQTLTLNKWNLKQACFGLVTSALCVVGAYAVFAATPANEWTQVRTASVSSSSIIGEAPEAMALAKRYDDLGYTLDAVRAGQQAVPTLSIASLPKDIGAVQDISLKKSLFFRTLLPMALQVNAEVAADRDRLTDIRNQLILGQTLSNHDQNWLDELASRYGTTPDNMHELMLRVAPVPTSLVLAQAAEESGWGSSRFAREGNALFGQWTWSDDHKGIVPTNREEGKTHRIRAFDTAHEAIAAYIHNLNTHPAYARLREDRAAGASGYALTATLDKYSERGTKYIASLKAIMEHNNLQPLDGVRLAENRHLMVSR